MHKTSLAELKERLFSRRVDGVAIDLVLSDRGTGLRSALLQLQRETKFDGTTRVLSLSGAFGGYDVLENLIELGMAGGRSTIQRVENALFNLSHLGQRKLSLVINDSHHIEAGHIELIVDALQHAAHVREIQVYLCMVFKKRDHYRRSQENPRVWECAYDFPRLPLLFQELFDGKRLQLMALKKDGLETLSRSEARRTVGELISKAS